MNERWKVTPWPALLSSEGLGLEVEFSGRAFVVHPSWVDVRYLRSPVSDTSLLRCVAVQLQASTLQKQGWDHFTDGTTRLHVETISSCTIH
jgi:hypothetical protein